MSGEHNLYQDWREDETLPIPSIEDVNWSQERWRGFNMGYKQAVKDAIDLLMIQHEAAKGSHNYWLVAANLVKAEFLPEEKNT